MTLICSNHQKDIHINYRVQNHEVLTTFCFIGIIVHKDLLILSTEHLSPFEVLDVAEL